MFIIHLGSSGFPKDNSAIVQRIKLTYKGLKMSGCNPLIISKHSLYEEDKNKRISRYQGIPYILTSPILTRPHNFFVRNTNRLMGYVGELIILVKKHKSIDTAIFSGPQFLELVYYRLLSKVLHFKLIVQYVEMSTAITYNRKKTAHINAILNDNYRFYFCDGIIVISELLKNHVLSKTKTLPIIKIPAICDFEEFESAKNIIQGEYLMFCGGLGYFSVIEFIIDLYCKLRELESYQGKLLLAIGVGRNDEEFLTDLNNIIKDCGYGESIILKTNVPHKELINFYLRAELLIAPFRNVVQDIAGFHHKVGEYCAAGKPIISTNLGEMKHYFKDGISAILADEYILDSYVGKLIEILPFKEKLKSIAEEGHKVGIENLNYLRYGTELKQFIDNL